MQKRNGGMCRDASDKSPLALILVEELLFLADEDLSVDVCSFHSPTGTWHLQMLLSCETSPDGTEPSIPSVKNHLVLNNRGEERMEL